MSKIETRKHKLVIDTPATIKGRRLVLELSDYWLTIRPKGTRQRLQVSYEGIYWLAARVEASRLVKER